MCWNHLCHGVIMFYPDIWNQQGVYWPTDNIPATLLWGIRSPSFVITVVRHVTHLSQEADNSSHPVRRVSDKLCCFDVWPPQPLPTLFLNTTPPRPKWGGTLLQTVGRYPPHLPSSGDPMFEYAHKCRMESCPLQQGDEMTKIVMGSHIQIFLSFFSSSFFLLPLLSVSPSLSILIDVSWVHFTIPFHWTPNHELSAPEGFQMNDVPPPTHTYLQLTSLQ